MNNMAFTEKQKMMFQLSKIALPHIFTKEQLFETLSKLQKAIDKYQDIVKDMQDVEKKFSIFTEEKAKYEEWLANYIKEKGITTTIPVDKVQILLASALHEFGTNPDN